MSDSIIILKGSGAGYEAPLLTSASARLETLKLMTLSILQPSRGLVASVMIRGSSLPVRYNDRGAGAAQTHY